MVDSIDSRKIHIGVDVATNLKTEAAILSTKLNPKHVKLYKDQGTHHLSSEDVLLRVSTNGPYDVENGSPKAKHVINLPGHEGRQYDPKLLAMGIVNASAGNDGKLIVNYPNYLDGRHLHKISSRTEFAIDAKGARILLERYFNLNMKRSNLSQETLNSEVDKIMAEVDRKPISPLRPIAKTKIKPIPRTSDQEALQNTVEDLKFFRAVKKTHTRIENKITHHLIFTHDSGVDWKCNANVLIGPLLRANVRPDGNVKFTILENNDLNELPGVPLKRTVEMTSADAYRTISEYMTDLVKDERSALLARTRYSYDYENNESTQLDGKIGEQITNLGRYEIVQNDGSKIIDLVDKKNRKTIIKFRASELATAILESTSQSGQTIQFYAKTTMSGQENTLVEFKIPPTWTAMLLGKTQSVLHKKDPLQIEELLKTKFNFPKNFKNEYDAGRRAFEALRDSHHDYTAQVRRIDRVA